MRFVLFWIKLTVVMGFVYKGVIIMKCNGRVVYSYMYMNTKAGVQVSADSLCPKKIIMFIKPFLTACCVAQ